MKHGSTRTGWVCALGGAVVAGLAACGSYSTSGAGNAFVGTWSCPTLPAGARTLSISEFVDNSLSIAGESDAGSVFCASDLWSYAGSTASMQAGTSCFGGASGLEVITVASFSMTVNGSHLTLSGAETLVNAGDAGSADASAKPTTQTLTLSGSCTKD